MAVINGSSLCRASGALEVLALTAVLIISITTPQAGAPLPGTPAVNEDSMWAPLLPGYAFAQAHEPGAFVTTWKTAAANQTVTIPVGNSTAVYDIDWGDGATETDATGDRVHTYADADTYTVSISGGF